ANLRSLGRLVMLSSDRGFTTLEDLSVYPSHPHDVHEGAFSFLVNYHALGSTFRHTLHTTHHYLNSIQTVCCLDLEGPFPHLEYAFREHLDRPGTINAVNELFGLVRDRPDHWRSSLPAFVRLNLYDTQALSMAATRFLEHVKKPNHTEGLDLVDLYERVWENDYHFKGSPNVTFWLAQLYYQLGFPDRSLSFLEETARRTGDDEVLLFLRGQCYQSLGMRDEARDCYRRSLSIKPDFTEARDCFEALRA
ncbi:MAG: tetratricopeptide repeat protein, partial [Candidatus Eremiobacterota bacterium]